MIVLDSSKAMGETGFNTAKRTLNVSTAQHTKPQKSFTSNFSIKNLVGSLKILSLNKCIIFVLCYEAHEYIIFVCRTWFECSQKTNFKMER